MGKPAARLTDMHVCPMVTGIVPHVGGPIVLPGAPTVVIGGLPAARVGDMATCVGPPDFIAPPGARTVLIGGLPAARQGDMTVHRGRVSSGCFTVLIGNLAGGTLSQQELQNIADGVNPNNGTINCGNIIDAVIDRLTGRNPEAVSPVEQDGSFPEIEQRHGVTLEWGHTFEDAFDAVAAGEDGTTAIVGIEYNDGTDASHVVVMTRQDGQVSIIEGQGGGEVINTPERANEIYNSRGTTTVGYGILR